MAFMIAKIISIIWLREKLNQESIKPKRWYFQCNFLLFYFLTEKSNIIFFGTAYMLCYVVLSNFENENGGIDSSISTDNSIQIFKG